MQGPSVELRPHQVRIIDIIKTKLQEAPSLLVAAPTASGKTVIMAEIIARAFRKGYPTGLLVHRQELVTQSEQTITRQAQHAPGVVWQSRREWGQPITIMAQDTVYNLEIPKGPRLHILFVDEAHHTAAPTWLATIHKLNPRYLVGFSATPFRQDREPLCPDPFADVIRPVTPKELIDEKWLCPALIQCPVLHDRNGEVQPISQASNLENIYHQAVRYAIAQNRTKILLYVSQTNEYTPLEVISRTTEVLKKAGITAGSISQETTSRQRKTVIDQFQAAAGPSVLVNYMTLTEGTDLPYVDAIIIGRNTDSESTIIQMIGRGLRPHIRKENCLVISYCDRPDMDDIIHYWRLDEPKEDQNKNGKKRIPSPTQLELAELLARFPRELSTMDNTRIQYPWFKPYDKRSLLALPLWSERNTGERYITVEPRDQDRWRVTTIQLNNQGISQVTKQQTSVASQDEAATLIQMALGENAPRVQRQAEWRLKPASPAQKKTWRNLQPRESQAHEALTAGEASDTIAQQRFLRRIDPKIL